MIVRYADDFVMGFQERAEAERFLAELGERLRKFGLELHPEKTRLIAFGRRPEDDWRRRGGRKPGDGFDRSCRVTSTITPYRAMDGDCERFAMGSSDADGKSYAAAGNDGLGVGNDWCLSSTGGFPRHGFYILTRVFALTPSIQDKSRMRETRSYGSVRGVAGDRYPYRDSHLPLPASAGNNRTLSKPVRGGAGELLAGLQHRGGKILFIG